MHMKCRVLLGPSHKDKEEDVTTATNILNQVPLDFVHWNMFVEYLFYMINEL